MITNWQAFVIHLIKGEYLFSVIPALIAGTVTPRGLTVYFLRVISGVSDIKQRSARHTVMRSCAACDDRSMRMDGGHRHHMPATLGHSHCNLDCFGYLPLANFTHLKTREVGEVFIEQRILGNGSRRGKRIAWVR